MAEKEEKKVDIASAWDEVMAGLSEEGQELAELILARVRHHVNGKAKGMTKQQRWKDGLMLIGAVARDTAAAAAGAAATTQDKGPEDEFVNLAYFCAVVLSDPLPQYVDEVHKFLAFAVIDALINELDTIEDVSGWIQDAKKVMPPSAPMLLSASNPL